MATPPNTVRYQMNNENRFFLCRRCRNHLAKMNTTTERIAGTIDGYFCRNAVNVRTDHISSRRFLFRLPVVNIYCNGCNSHLGEKFIALNMPRQCHNVFEGRFLLHSDRILYWDGTRSIYADTRMPVSDD